MELFPLDRLIHSNSTHAIQDAILQRLVCKHLPSLPENEIFTDGSIDREKLTQVLSMRGPHLDPILMNRLALIADLDCDQHAARLRSELQKSGVTIPENVSTADLAALLTLERPAIAERLYVELLPSRRRRVASFYAVRPCTDAILNISDESRVQFERAIERSPVFFRAGGLPKLHFTHTSNGFRAVVSQGDVLHRVETVNVDRGCREVKTFFPVMRDIIEFDRQHSEIRIAAHRPSSVPVYLDNIAEWVFGDRTLFGHASVPPLFYNLRRIVDDGGRSLGVTRCGLKSVTARSIAWTTIGAPGSWFRYDATHGICDGGQRLATLLGRTGRPMSLDLTFTLADGRERRVRLMTPNIAIFYNDQWSDNVFNWLRAASFIYPRDQAFRNETSLLFDAA